MGKKSKALGRDLRRVLLLALLGLLSGPPGELAAQRELHGRVIGLVVDQIEGRGIAGVEVRLRSLAEPTESGSRGTFAFDRVPPGWHVLEFSHLSYRVRTDSILVPPEETLEVRVTLTPEPIALDPIRVSVRSKVLETSGFFRRRAQGLSGTHLTRSDIEERRPMRVTDLFASVPGARLANRDGVLGPIVVFPRGKLMGGGTATCFPAVWLDGVLTNIVDLDQISVETMEGIEIYQGAGTPIRFNSDCGAIIIWTRVPEKRGRGA
jgi:hypothetical protein